MKRFGLLLYFLIFLIRKSDQNQAPYFYPPLESTYFFAESNQTKVGDVLLHLAAIDPDDEELEFGLIGEFYNKLLEIKRIDGKNADIVLKQPFDREVQEKYENIVFYVKDKPGNQILQAVRFVIVDIDDNAPVFINIPYRVDVFENTSLNSIVFNSISAYDLDGPLYNEFKFEVFETGSKNKSIYFTVETQFISSGHYNGSVKLIKNLDYENQKVHLLTVAATGINSHLSSSTDLIINVIDSSDMPPEFNQSPYYFKIAEEMPIGTSVFSVFAKDGDIGINNKCAYEINYENSLAAQYFSIERESGELRIRKRIDRESKDINEFGDLLEFSVIAYETNDVKSKSEVHVTVAIIDINDNEPVFDLSSYDLSITPKTTNGAALTILNAESINIQDLDKGINGSFSLTLDRIVGKSITGEYLYEDDNQFDVVPSKALNYANINIRVKNEKSINSKSGKTIHYCLRAHDNGIQGRVTKVEVLIKIVKINEHAPKFNQDFYEFYINENSNFNTTVDNNLNAIDNDGNESIYGEIHYELKNGQNIFEIDNKTGRIYTISNDPDIELDRESIDKFYLSVDAVDGGGLRTTAKIIIKLNDLNDNPPQFVYPNSNNYYTGLIEENSRKWLENVKLQSIDNDIGINGAVVYKIMDGDFVHKFDIDKKTKKLVLKENLTLDFEELYELKKSKRLFDFGFLKQIEMPNDEIHLHLIVLVRDLGSPSLMSKTVVKIIVKDVNDNSPKFDKSVYYGKVFETDTYGDVLRVNAVDMDAIGTPNSKVNYRIVNGSKEKFLINANTGLIEIIPNAFLDRDLFGENYTIEVVANDFGANLALFSNVSEISNSDTCKVIIEIVDVNNKKPNFLNEINHVNISEDLNVNKTFIVLEAFDLDLNAKLVYSLGLDNHSIEAYDEYDRPINSSLVKDWFEIYQNSGEIIIKSPIDREIAEKIKLMVFVEDKNADGNFRPQISAAIVNIRIVDVNDNYPTIYNANKVDDVKQGPIYELYAHVAENSKYGTEITRIKSFDFDLDRSLKYLVSNSTKNEFISIDQIKGSIYVDELIDYEKFKWVNMTIFVFDSGEPERKYTTLLFYCKIDDVNDNVPMIDKIIVKNGKNIEHYSIGSLNFGNATIRLRNTVTIGNEIAEIHATDKDEGINAEISFYFDESHYKDSKIFSINSQTGKIYLNGKLNREAQTLYTLDIVVADRGIPQLKSRLLLKIVITDEYNNALIFHKKQICLSNLFECDKDFQNILIKKFEGETNEIAIGSFNYAKLIDSRKSDLCYYLLGADKEYFNLNKSNAVLTSSIIFDRENRSIYEVLIQASEKCHCNILNETCDFSKTDLYDSTHLSTMKITISIEDLNDNKPFFNKKIYIAGVTLDSNYGDILLEGLAKDFDTTTNLSFSVVDSTLHRFWSSDVASRTIVSKIKFPFLLEYEPTVKIEKSLDDKNEMTEARFFIKVQSNLREQVLNIDQRNVIYEFKINVTDGKKNQFDLATIKIYIVNKSQRLKLTFSHPIGYISENMQSLKRFLNNITGFSTNIDSVNNHTYSTNENETSDFSNSLTDVFMHFVDYSTHVSENNTDFMNRLNFSLVPAENIINILDRSKDLTLMRKYRLVLAEQFNGSKNYKENVFKFNIDENSHVLSVATNTQTAQFLLIKLLLTVLCIILAILLVLILILCFIMRRKYKHKLQSERAIIKTFDLSTIVNKYNSHNDANNANNINNDYGYTNRAFINNAENNNILSPYIPGTNLYSYEGSNPVWLKKYDKIETKSSSIRTSASDETESATSSASSYSKTVDTYKLNNNHRMIQNEVKTFYLKQQSIEQSPSPTANNNQNDIKQKNTNHDHTLSITSNESCHAGDNVCIIKNKKNDSKLNDLSYNIKDNEKLENSVLTRMDSLKYNKNKKRLTDENKVPSSALNDLIQLQDKSIPQNIKDCSEMYALEHTVI